MKLHDPSFEARLKRDLQDRRQALKRDFTQPDWRFSLPEGASLLLALTSFVVSVLTASLLARLMKPAPEVLSGAGSLVAFLFTAALCGFHGHLQAALSRPADLSTLLRLPVSTDQMFGWHWRRVRPFVWAWFGSCLGILVALWAQIGGSRYLLPAALPLAALGAVGAVAFALLPLGRLARWVFYVGCAFALIVVARAPVLFPVLQAFFTEYGNAINCLHPGGWVVAPWMHFLGHSNAVMAYGLLAPLLLLAASFWRRRATLRARFEQGVADLGDVYAPDAAVAVLQRRRVEELIPETVERVEEPLAALKGRPAGRARETFATDLQEAPKFRTKDAWQQWVFDRLTPREKLLTHIYGGQWSFSVARAWLPGTLWLAIMLVCMGLRTWFGSGLAVTLYCAGMVVLLLFTLPLFSAIPWAYRAMGVLPVQFREVVALEWKLARLGFLVGLLPCTLAGVGLGLLLPDAGWLWGLKIGARFGVYACAIWPWIMVQRFSHTLKAVGILHRPGRALATVVTLTVLLVLTLFGFYGVLTPRAAGWGLLPLGGLASFLVLRLQGAAWNRRWFEIPARSGR